MYTSVGLWGAACGRPRCLPFASADDKNGSNRYAMVTVVDIVVVS